MARKVLVASASKHGSTMDIADVIAGVLTHRGFEVTDTAIDESAPADGFEAAVIGSAVYVGRWMPEAISFVEKQAPILKHMPVWLFSSGPVGDPPKPETDPASVGPLIEAIEPREHRVFAGKLDPDHLGLGEKLIVGMVRAPSGDYRDFPAIEAWAGQIADTLEREADRAAKGEDDKDEYERTREALLIAAMR